jgi:hypothetical protein
MNIFCVSVMDIDQEALDVVKAHEASKWNAEP